MARNGSGTYTRVTGTPYIYGTVIDQVVVNSEFDDIATALTNSLAKNGETTPTGNLPMGGYKLTGLGAATTAGDAVRYEQAGTCAIVETHAATSKATPVDADEIPLADSAATFGLKKLTWSNIKATLKTYFDTLYRPITEDASGFKNKIIGGDFGTNPWQRGTSGSTSGAYLADRFVNLSTGTAPFTFQRSTSAPAGFKNSLQLYATSITNAQYLRAFQNIESVNSLPLVGETITVSFYARASEASNVTVFLGYPSVVDTFSTIEVPHSASIAITDSWARYSYTVTLAASASGYTAANGLRLILSYSPATTGAREVYFAGIQLEKGSVATSFENRSVGQELALCQRYYYRLTAASAALSFASAFNDSTTVAIGDTAFPVTMRSAPSALEQDGTATDYRVRITGSADVACSAVPTFSAATPWCASTAFTVAAGLTAGQASQLRSAAANAYLGWSAEL